MKGELFILPCWGREAPKSAYLDPPMWSSSVSCRLAAADGFPAENGPVADVQKVVVDGAVAEAQLGPGAGLGVAGDHGDVQDGCPQILHRMGLPAAFGSGSTERLDVEASAGEHFTDGTDGSGRATGGILRHLGENQQDSRGRHGSPRFRFAARISGASATAGPGREGPGTGPTAPARAPRHAARGI